jgi:hypothetical protein
VDGRKLSFRLVGINNQNFLMEDSETGSWWQQVTGEAVFGPLAGRKLELVHHDELSFDLWRRERPEGQVLRPAADAPWKEFSENWEEETGRLPVVTPAGPDEPLPPREVVIGVNVNGKPKAYPLAVLAKTSPVLDTVGGVPLVLVVAADGRSVRAFEARLDGRDLPLFAKPGSSPPVLFDEGGTEWSFAGEAVSGPHAGRRLQKVFALKDYWFDWKAYNPGTTVYQAGFR